ncbi:MAG: 5-(carboxyamino)imidazole ribonucleotide mutase [Eubacteriales bacterium]|nr:5-(carboxyamino)imidazole ribonucleotide mutase [Clostridiales bacterium]MDD6018784.1 5-(carboxyamino)imidazole ribonucleotide mutase [Clostridiales bacterium]MDD7687927.1 5-(carboxyamino)imidazole ribonucleotide mutase [Clostridiales bacterium]MDY2598165.1 5-(carboxyamino)imidazole ribonucleotide mutase [Eubacteriales bacterium]MDY3309256.1 5-(carboxyamino)imidazole ribonucleotide mutase [Eubacteriales bacterium]
MRKVAVIMGSANDFDVVKKAADRLEEMNIPYEMRVMSAHRTAGDVLEFARNARSEGFGVIIACAGMAAHLAGFIAANTTLPVIGVPLKSNALDGMDALLATVQMPTGIPVAAVAVDGAANAAILAAEILALSDECIAERLVKMRDEMAEGVREKDRAVRNSKME